MTQSTGLERMIRSEQTPDWVHEEQLRAQGNDARQVMREESSLEYQIPGVL